MNPTYNTIYFDMDGTLVDLYNFPNWEKLLTKYNTLPYRKAESLLTKNIYNFLNIWIKNGGKISIISYLSKNSCKKYDSAVRQAKKRWLKRNFPFPLEKIHILKYDTPKYYKKNIIDDILIDDDEKNIKEWKSHGGVAFLPEQFNNIIKKGIMNNEHLHF